MGAKVKIGSGRAMCQVCGGKIGKDQTAVEVYGYQFSQQIHSEPKDCQKRWLRSLEELEYKNLIEALEKEYGNAPWTAEQIMKIKPMKAEL